MRKRVVITGMGCISPVGNDATSVWNNLAAGKSGIGMITHYDTGDFRVKIAAEVKDFDPGAIFGQREVRHMDRFAQFALAATHQAVQDAGLEINAANRDRIGVVIGTGIGGIGTLYEQMKVFSTRGPQRVSPFLVPMMIPDSAAGLIAIHFGVRGVNMAVVTACATGTNAIGEAVEIIRRGSAEIMIAGGSEASIVPIAMGGLGVMTALSTCEDPARACRPFDLNRDGFVMGEGSAVLVLESLDSALQRGARILAEVSGYGTTNDAFHISAPAENGAGAALCMRLALENAGLGIEDIDYINAHGTSTQLNDKSETAAIKNVFGEKAYEIPVSSTKSMTGHLLGASGALEALIAVKTIENQTIPPTINYETPDPHCDLDYVTEGARKSNLVHVMSNSFGFGGHNATVIISKYKENGKNPALDKGQ